MSNDIYVNADMIIIMNNDDLLNLLIIYSPDDAKFKLIILNSVYSRHRDCMEMMYHPVMYPA